MMQITKLWLGLPIYLCVSRFMDKIIVNENIEAFVVGDI